MIGQRPMLLKSLNRGAVEIAAVQIFRNCKIGREARYSRISSTSRSKRMQLRTLAFASYQPNLISEIRYCTAVRKLQSGSSISYSGMNRRMSPGQPILNDQQAHFTY